MRTLLDRVRATLRTLGPIPNRDESSRQAAGEVVRDMATGNVHLQHGDYATRQDIDRQYESVKSYNFNSE